MPFQKSFDFWFLLFFVISNLSSTISLFNSFLASSEFGHLPISASFYLIISALKTLILCMLGNFSCFNCHPLTFFFRCSQDIYICIKISLFKKFRKIKTVTDVFSLANWKLWRACSRKNFLKKLNLKKILLHIFKCTSDWIFSWQQTIWTLIRLLPRAVWSVSILFAI